MSDNILLPIRRRYVGIRKAERLGKILHRMAMRKYQQDLGPYIWRIAPVDMYNN